jgi:hypothetical protein
MKMLTWSPSTGLGNTLTAKLLLGNNLILTRLHKLPDPPQQSLGHNFVPQRELGNEPFMFQRNTQNHEKFCRVRSTHQHWRVKRALLRHFQSSRA